MTIQAHHTDDIGNPFAGATSVITVSLRRVLHLLGRGMVEAIDKLTAEWPERIRQRRRLAELSDRELADFGASRSDAWREISKPFWRK